MDTGLPEGVMTMDLEHRFTHHAPDTTTAERHAVVRAEIGALAMSLDAQLPEGREKSVVMTKLEEAMFWANAAIARNGVST